MSDAYPLPCLPNADLRRLLLISTRLGFDGSREVVQGALWQTGMKIGFHDETASDSSHGIHALCSTNNVTELRRHG